MLPSHLAVVGVDRAEPSGPALLRIHATESAFVVTGPRRAAFSPKYLEARETNGRAPIHRVHEQQIERWIPRWSAPFGTALGPRTEPSFSITRQRRFCILSRRRRRAISH